jgi:hypothetical protein
MNSWVAWLIKLLFIGLGAFFVYKGFRLTSRDKTLSTWDSKYLAPLINVGIKLIPIVQEDCLVRTHIVFGLSSVSAIEQVMYVSNEQVIVVLDDLMWGPIGNILSEDVQQTSVRWWKRVLNDEDFAAGVPDVFESYMKIGEWANTLTEIDSLQFWLADNSTDYTGLICLVSNLPKSISMSLLLFRTPEKNQPKNKKAKRRQTEPAFCFIHAGETGRFRNCCFLIFGRFGYELHARSYPF